MKRGYALVLGVVLMALGGAWWYGLEQFLAIVERNDLMMSVFGWTGMFNYLAGILALIVAGMMSIWYAIREE